MYSISVYRTNVENSQVDYEFRNEKELHRDFYTILLGKYDCTEEEAIEICSWAELAAVGEWYDTNNISVCIS